MNTPSVNLPKIGMKLNKPAWALEGAEFSLLNNGAIQFYDSFLTITNESSHLLCSAFKPGYKVIGVLPINVQNRTIFFLVNPNNFQSEIGYINNVSYDDISDPEINCSTCNNPLTEKEIDVLKSICSYHTIVNANCLNFDINHPISATYEIGIDVLTGQPDENNTTIFFTDDLNPRRYLNINNYPKIQIATGDCNTPIYNTELDCSQIKAIKEYQQPCINYVDTPLGGSNKAGVYQFAMAYATEPNPVYGTNLTDYSYITNPISLSSKNRIVTIDTDYDSGKSIKIEINNIDTSFQWVNLVVIKTINSLTEAFIVDTIPVNGSSLTYTYTGNNYQQEARITFEELQKRRAIYNTAKGVTSVNKHLLWWDLKDQREINLQPVISQIPLQWQTIEAKEGFYGNPISANFVSFERDETYPFGIEFHKSNGYKTPTFLFVGRDKQYYVDNYNIDVDQIQSGDNVLSSTGCEPNPLNKLWQVYNTAQKIGQSPCYSNPTGDVTIVIPTFKTCFSDTWEIDSSGNPTTNVDPCCSPSGECNQDLDDYCCCEIVEVVPSGTVSIPDYQCNDITLVPPPITNPAPSDNYEVENPLTGETIPSAAEFILSPTWIPQSNLCSIARQLFPSTTGNCPKETLIATDAVTDPSSPSIISNSLIPYMYFTEAGIASVPTNEQTLCDGTVNTPKANSYWMQFSATSNNLLLSLNVTKNYVVKVLEGDSCDNLSSVVNFNSVVYPTCVESAANDTTCITLNNLTEGNTYFIQVFVTEDLGDPEDVAYGQICLSTPTPLSYIDYEQNQVVRWRCSYRDGEETFVYPADPTCFTSPYEYGDFAYHESTLTYPQNKDVWGDLCGQPIRHFRFPDSCVSHIHNQIPKPEIGGTSSFQTNRIYPIGVKVSTLDIKQALENAVNLGLITNEEKLEFTSFSIKRGNRGNNRSVLAKGLLYDVWKTPKTDGEGDAVGFETKDLYHYPNYPYNDLQDDVFLLNEKGGTPIQHPFANSNYTNNRYTFHSPNTSFQKPELGTELKLESVEWGLVTGNPNRVEKHAEYILLTKKAYDVSKTFAALQINHEASLQAMAAGEGISVLGSGTGAIIYYVIYYAIGLATGFATNFTTYTTNWLEIIRNLGEPRNPAIYLTSIANYNNYTCVPNSENTPKRRELVNYRYLGNGNYEFTENGEYINFNNFNRESSVYLSIKKPSSSPFLKPDDIPGTVVPEDTSRVRECVLNQTFIENATSYYASVKQFIPDQYGTVDQIEWLDTGFCGNIDWTEEFPCPSGETNPSGDCCETIFGGDTYINRFALKRKMSFFLQDMVGFEEQAPVMYQYLSNVGFPKYYFNTIQTQQDLDKYNAALLAPPSVEFDCDNSFPFYKRGKFYLYNYGIPYFICESDYNVDLRHAEDERNYKDFYPNVGSIIEWTQQYKNPISFDNTYFYNVDYSKQNRENFYSSLPESWKNSYSNLRANYPNRIIYSPQGVPNWIEQRAADFYDFPFEDGKLVGVTNLNQQQVLVRQENTSRVFNAFITVQSSLANIAITAGEMFNEKPREYYKTDLGYGGSSNFPIVNTPFGSFWVDTQNPSILQLQGDSLKDITRDKDTKSKIQWFNEFLPFQILKDFPEIDVDNPYSYFGISLGWDNKYDRLFVTKQDYKLKPEYKGKVVYENNNFFYNDLIIFPSNPTYFENKCFTIAYSPLLQEWISFYDFIPSYYNSLETYFQTGYNFGENTGIYSHNQTNRHFQTFRGTTYPFILEYGIKSNLKSNILNNVRVNAEFQRWQDNLSYFSKDNVFYNTAEVYNQNQATGKINLIPKEVNNQQQLLLNNKIENGGINSIATNIENFWSFNFGLNDYTAKNNQPIYTFNSKMYKELNPSSLNYNQFIKPPLRGDFFLLRFTNNKTPYRILHKFSINNTTNSAI